MTVVVAVVVAVVVVELLRLLLCAATSISISSSRAITKPFQVWLSARLADYLSSCLCLDLFLSLARYLHSGCRRLLVGLLVSQSGCLLGCLTDRLAGWLTD